MRGRKRLRKKKERARFIGYVYATLLEMMPGSRQLYKYTMGRIQEKTKRAIINGFKLYCRWYRSTFPRLMPPPDVRKKGNRLDITMYLSPDEATHQMLHDKMIHHEHTDEAILA